MSRSGTVDRLRRALAALRDQPPAAVRTLPAEFYTSEAFLALEKEQIFRREWVCLGHAGEVANPGDFFTTDLVDEPLLVVRGDDGAIRVLSNVCRHRGNLVAEGAGNARFFSCAYHGWTYGRRGSLETAPLMDRVAGFDRSAYRLPAFRTEIWENFIFVNLSGDAEPLATRLAELTPRLAIYHAAERHHLFRTEELWRTNWKCLTENFMEGYHLSIAHYRTLHPITPTALCEKAGGNGAFTAYNSRYSPAWPERGPYRPDFPPAARRYSLLFCVFPSFVVSYAPHFTLWMCIRPAGTEGAAIRWGVAGHVADPDASVVRDYVALCNAFNAEDRARLEAVQQGMRSRHYVPGPLAPEDYEGTIRDLHQYLASRLASTGAAEEVKCS